MARCFPLLLLAAGMVVVECRQDSEALEAGVADVELDGTDKTDEEDMLDDDDDDVAVLGPGSEA